MSKIFDEAKKSSWGLKKMNFIFQRGIPFNKPHKLNVEKMEQGYVKVDIPYIKKNMNHLKGIHACCIATGAEYTSGLVLMSCLKSEDYRIIMESIEVKYHYQAKMACYAEYRLYDEQIEKEIVSPLQNEESVFFSCQVKVFDTDKNHVATGFINWQIKKWGAVKTKL